MAGHLISLYFKERGHDVVGFARSESHLLDRTIIGDAADLGLIKCTISNGDYDAVINCIGLLNQFAEDNKAMAVLLNGYMPHYLAEITKETKTRVIHMSTDVSLPVTMDRITKTHYLTEPHFMIGQRL